MPAAPRQGRKGGKISSSPAGAPADGATPDTVSPGSLLPGATAAGMPTDPQHDLEFKIEALIDSKKYKAAKEGSVGREASKAATAEANNKAADGSSGAPTPPANAAVSPAASAVDANVFKFDINAIDQIGQGVVIGGNKNVRTDTRKAEASTSEMRDRLKKVLDGQKVLSERLEQGPNPKGLTEALEIPVVIVKRSIEALSLAVTISKSTPASAEDPTARVLVVVPRYFEVSIVADGIRSLLAGDATVGNSAVGELCGQSFTGLDACRLWVANASTAFTYLRSQKSLAPFTHLVVPNISRMTPLVAYFLWGVRERVLRQSANLDTKAPPLHLVVCADDGNQLRFVRFFAEQEPALIDPVACDDVTEFSYDESNALVDMSVLDADIDTTGKFPGPHRKLVEHVVRLATSICTLIATTAKTAQCIHVITADMRDTVEALLAAELPNTVVFNGRNRAEEGANGDVAGKTRIYVVPAALHFATVAEDVVNFVLDMGTVRRLSQQSKSECFIAESSTEWTSAREVKEHKDLLGTWCPGGYFALYPPAAAAVFATNDSSIVSQQASIFDSEDALLQCSRSQIPVVMANDSLVPTDAERLEQVVHNLSEKCLIASPADLSITFLGELASRLPLEIDLAYFLINGCAVGLGEAALLIASVCALPFRVPMGDSAAEAVRWRERVTASRKKYAGSIARQSDVLADALVFLEWYQLKAAGKPTHALVEELQVYEQRLEQISVLMDHLHAELSDYVFLDSYAEAATLDAIKRSITSSATVFTFLEAVALSRRVSFVRDAGSINEKTRAAALVFVRTSKKVSPNLSFPSSVPWEVGAALVAVDLRNYNNRIACARSSVISTAYLFASLLLLYPRVEYSEPLELAGKGRVVYFGMTCNRQMKRFRVSIEEAAAILDFRQKWNTALGYLQALRTRRRPISRRRFELDLKEKDRLFDLSQFYASLQRELVNLVTELEVVEHQGSFATFALHCFSPAPVLAPAEGSEASDVLLTKRLRDGELAQMPGQGRAQGPAESPASQKAGSPSQGIEAMTFPTQRAVVEDDEDEIEFIADSYFLKHGPIIDDDDE